MNYRTSAYDKISTTWKKRIRVNALKKQNEEDENNFYETLPGVINFIGDRFVGIDSLTSKTRFIKNTVV